MAFCLVDTVKLLKQEFKKGWNEKRNLHLEEERKFHERVDKFCKNESDEMKRKRHKLYQGHLKKINKIEKQFKKGVMELINKIFGIEQIIIKDEMQKQSND